MAQEDNKQGRKMKEYELLIDSIAAGGSALGGLAECSTKLGAIEGLPEEGKEVEVELRDPILMERIRVRAIFSSNPQQLPGADRLWLVRQDVGRIPQPWAVKILQRIEEEEEERVVPLQKRRMSLGERRGRMLKELLEEREKREKGG